MATFHFDLVSPEKLAFSGEVEQVDIPGVEGDFGVLAGTYRFGIGAIFKSLPRPSDGVVLLNETQLQGLSDHTTIRLNHFGMLFSKRCTAQIACFLATGSFGHAGVDA